MSDENVWDTGSQVIPTTLKPKAAPPRTCLACRFYVAEQTINMKWRIKEKEHTKKEDVFDQCTRYPKWEMVYANHYCGEHKYCKREELDKRSPEETSEVEDESPLKVAVQELWYWYKGEERELVLQFVSLDQYSNPIMKNGLLQFGTQTQKQAYTHAITKLRAAYEIKRRALVKEMSDGNDNSG